MQNLMQGVMGFILTIASGCVLSATPLAIDWLANDLDRNQLEANLLAKKFEIIDRESLRFQFTDPDTKHVIEAWPEFDPKSSRVIKVVFVDKSADFAKQHAIWHRLLGLPNRETQAGGINYTNYCFTKNLGIILTLESDKSKLGYVFTPGGIAGCENSLAERLGTGAAYFGAADRLTTTDNSLRTKSEIIEQQYRNISIDRASLTVMLLGPDATIAPEGSRLVHADDGVDFISEDFKDMNERTAELFYTFPELGDARCIVRSTYMTQGSIKTPGMSLEELASFLAALRWSRTTRGEAEQGPVYNETIGKALADQLRGASIITSRPLLDGAGARAEFSLKRGPLVNEKITRSEFNEKVSRSENYYFKVSLLDRLQVEYECKTLQTFNADEAIKRLTMKLPEDWLKRLSSKATQ